MSSAVHGYYLRADWGRIYKDVRLSFPSPGSTLIAGSGLQEIRARVKGSDPLGGDVGATLELYESGVFKATLYSGPASAASPGTTLSGTWNSSLLTDSSGAGVEVRLTSDGGINNGLTLEALEWNAALPVSEIIGGGAASDELTGSVAASPGVSTIPLYLSGDYPTEDYPQEDYPGDYAASTQAPSEESTGTLSATAVNSPISLSGASSEESVGTLTATGSGGTIDLTGVGSEESQGTLTPVGGAVSVSLTGLSTEESIGALTAFQPGTGVSLTGLATEETTGSVAATPLAAPRSLTGLASEETLGSVSTQPGTSTIALVGLPSEEEAQGGATVYPGAVYASVSVSAKQRAQISVETKTRANRSVLPKIQASISVVAKVQATREKLAA